MLMTFHTLNYFPIAEKFSEQKLPSGQSSDEWTIREKLALASSVVRSGDQNW